MFVEPLIVPDTVSDPADVVTVQSPVCALGLDSTALTQTCVASMRESVMSVGREDTLFFETSITPIFCPVKLRSSDIVFIYAPFYGATHPRFAKSVVTVALMSVSVLSALPLMS